MRDMNGLDVIALIEGLGGETEIVGRYGTEVISRVSERDGMELWRASGWRQYSRRFGARRASLAYLVGVDDNGPWAVRVPGCIESVEEALEWHTPALVHAARADGRRCARQGDVWAVAMGRRARRDDASTGRGLPDSHRVSVRSDGSRWLLHEPADGRKHRAVRLPAGPVRFAVGPRIDGRGCTRD